MFKISTAMTINLFIYTGVKVMFQFKIAVNTCPYTIISITALNESFLFHENEF